jgi:2,4-dienoyl-CoA reductase-like NADH-dependent reductase (Old Yellow Enzyme family)/thioredoxin reductase
MTRDMIAFYEERARGGAAIVTVSEATTHHTGKSHGRLINLENPFAIQSLTDAARAIRRHGAVASIELNHGGMYSEMDVLNESRDSEIFKYGASDMVLPDGKRVREMPLELIRTIIDAYRDGAKLAKRAGFDMVMLHGGHGWLIEQFLSPATNRRTDSYGVSLENRARLALEIIDAVRGAVGASFPIEFRMSGVENIDGGYDLAGAVEFARLIESKIDLLHVSAGFGEDNFAMTHPPMFAPHGVNVHLAAEIKRHVSVPVATVGALNEPAEMERIIASGEADVVCMARALLADPELPRKVERNRDDEILRCLRCFTCHAERMLTQTRVCAINPVIGREYESRFALPASAPKRVLVVGGGPGGITAALTAAGRGHAVTLCEASPELGGALLCERGIPFKKASLDFVTTRALQLKNAGVQVRLCTPVNRAFVDEYAPDALIVAVGATAAVPPIAGIDGANVVVANNLHNEINRVGHSVAILGGGLVGCESAVHLAQTGRSVTVVEMGEKLAPDANPRHRPILMKLLSELAATLVSTRAVAVTERGLLVRGADGVERLIEADTVIVAAGQKSRSELADSLRGSAPVVSLVGDCVSPRNIREATFRGYHAALDI